MVCSQLSGAANLFVRLMTIRAFHLVRDLSPVDLGNSLLELAGFLVIYSKLHA